MTRAKELLRKASRETGITLSEKRVPSFMTYLTELKKWNRAYNLTALKTDEDIIVKHFLDSLLYLKALPEDISNLADAGTGAGFPGIPIKIVRPDMDIALIESSRKKCAFLRHIIRTLKLSGINVIEDRLENLGKEYEGCFDVIVSRATFSIKEFLQSACPYVKKGGMLVLNKGPKAAEELREADRLPVKEIFKLQLPVINAVRNLIVLEC
ncbi:MAG: 16S rRNA (guanine(527)-N(7))-methyltransferase RsmG [Nitrospirae bacterium]|nr:16S rRNA (guanine(527)-N(7))-methyltransferase RsmG [Nitrospirota bacterium]